MPLSLAQARTLCSASELALVSASTRNEIGKLSAAKLRQKVVRARKLRDKWRDQSLRQRRATQTKQAARQTTDNARSQKKADLFAEVLQRFEDRLAKVDQVNTSPSPGRPPRKVRAVQHRTTRAAVKDELEQARQEMDEKGKAGRPKRVKTQAAKTPAGRAGSAGRDKTKTAPTANMADRTKTAKSADRAQKKSAAASPKASDEDGRKSGAAAETAARPKASRQKTPLEAAKATQNLSTSKVQQRRASTAAKQQRVKASGAVRIQKHISAQNKRNQGKRDSR